MDLHKVFKKKKIAVLCGGWSAERKISLLTGRAVVRALRDDGFDVVEVDLTKDLASVLRRKKIGFVFIALHGPYGEDGTVQGMLEVLGIPYSGPGVLASALCMDKAMTKVVWERDHLPTPRWWDVSFSGGKPAGPHIRSLEKRFPLVVKPVAQGSAIGISIVRSVGRFRKALKVAGRYSPRVLVEEYIAGREIAVGILGGRPLEVIEIRPKGKFYDFDSKYRAGGSAHIIPARMERKKRDQVKALAVRAAHLLKCELMSRIDMIVDHAGRPYLLEANTIPGLTATSLFPEAARFEGIGFGELVRSVITLSLHERR